MERKIKHIKIGDRIRTKRDMSERELFCKSEVVWEVISVYPHHILTIDRSTGIRRSFSYGDLIVMNIERQSDEMEALKAEHIPWTSI